MINKVPQLDVIDSVLNVYFQDTEVGGYAKEDKDGAIYIYNANGSLYGLISSDVCIELLNRKEENSEITTT